MRADVKWWKASKPRRDVRSESEAGGFQVPTSIHRPCCARWRYASSLDPWAVSASVKTEYDFDLGYCYMWGGAPRKWLFNPGATCTLLSIQVFVCLVISHSSHPVSLPPTPFQTSAFRVTSECRE